MKGYMERAMAKFAKDENLEGVEIMREGLSYYRDKLRKVTGDTPDLDVGLLLFAFKTMLERLKQMVPAINDVEKLCDNILATVVVTIPQKGGGDDA